jgi:hypothetical protein
VVFHGLSIMLAFFIRYFKSIIKNDLLLLIFVNVLQKYPVQANADGTNPDKHEYHSLYYHKLGTDASADVLVADFRDDPNLMTFIFIFYTSYNLH